MQDYSKILYEAYEKFLLPLGGKKVPTPYRINIPPDPHPARQGKSSPKTLIEETKNLAKQQGFDLNKATVEEMGDFMRKNKLGIDCSGFAYRMLNYLAQKTQGKSLTDFGLPHVGRTNVAKLTSSEFAKRINSLQDAKPGDLIRFVNQQGRLHVLLVLDNKNGEITYTHSSEAPNLEGVQIEKINKLPKEADGIWRLKVLS